MVIGFYDRSLADLRAQWSFYRSFYALVALPTQPPSAEDLRRRARDQEREDAARGYRIVEPAPFGSAP